MVGVVMEDLLQVDASKAAQVLAKLKDGKDIDVSLVIMICVLVV